MKNVNREKHNEYNKQYYHKKRQELIDKLGGKCSICGSTEHLEFDHKDPFSKKVDVSAKLTSTNIIKCDINKLQLLCEDCHNSKSKKDHSSLKNIGELNPSAKLTSEQVFEIREKYPTGNYSYSKLAKEYDVSKTQIINIVKGRYRVDG